MAQLIQMRQRIKAIDTIKKITHAMRLISMSNHSRLKGKGVPLTNYTTALHELFYTIKDQAPTWSNPILYPTAPVEKTLVVLIGSQKGLCGSFNTSLFKHFEHSMTENQLHNVNYLAVGKKALEYLKTHPHTKKGVLLHSYPEFSSNSLFAIAHALMEEIVYTGKEYTNVTFISNATKTFFTQKPQAIQLIPFKSDHHETTESLQDYEWEQSPAEILDMLAIQCTQASIQNILFQSLLAEQAARFLSMDSSTRNAENLLEATELQYNKLRQAKITKELTELIGSF